LRNHGMKAVLPGEFPERAFSVEYARKDLAHTRCSSRAETGVDARGARTVDGWLGGPSRPARKKYHPVISRLIGR
jgi:hypothetical protein